MTLLPENPPPSWYDAAREATDEVLGPGTYAAVNAGNPDPRVQAAIERGAVTSWRHPITGGRDDVPTRNELETNAAVQSLPAGLAKLIEAVEGLSHHDVLVEHVASDIVGVGNELTEIREQVQRIANSSAIQASALLRLANLAEKVAANVPKPKP